MATQHSDTPKIVGYGRILCAFFSLPVGSEVHVYGLLFSSFSFFIFLILFFFTLSIYSLSAVRHAENVGEMVETGLGRLAGRSWSNSPPRPCRLGDGAVFKHQPSPKTAPSPCPSTPRVKSFISWEGGFSLAKFLSTAIAGGPLCVKRRILSNFISHQCYESDRMYEQTGGSHPLHSLCRTRGALLFLNWHVIDFRPGSLPALFFLSFPRDNISFSSFLFFYQESEREREKSCDLRPTCTHTGLAYPSRLTLVG